MMFFISSPFRVSLIGGGTDYKKFFNEYGGRTIGFAINHGCLISVNKSETLTYKYRLVYSEVEETNDINEIKHKMLATFLKENNFEKVEIHYDATLGKQNGLGTSSAFACALEAASIIYRGDELEEYTIAKRAIHLERELMQDYGGWQDQVFSAYGGIADIKFENNKFYVSSIRPNKNSISKLNQNLILIAVARDVDKKKLNKNKKKLNENIISLRSFKDLYDSTSKALFQGDIDDLKLILNECHLLKQKYTSVHNKKTKFICEILDVIKCSYKVIGSGNGGSIFTFGDDYIYKKILHNFKLNNIKDITILPVKINFSGTKIIKPFNNFN